MQGKGKGKGKGGRGRKDGNAPRNAGNDEDQRKKRIAKSKKEPFAGSARIWDIVPETQDAQDAGSVTDSPREEIGAGSRHEAVRNEPRFWKTRSTSRS